MLVTTAFQPLIQGSSGCDPTGRDLLSTSSHAILNSDDERRGFLISEQRVSPTIERAMVTAHNMTYADYEQSLDKQIQVEARREKEYRKAKVAAQG
jgi:hypothetical protein